MLVENRARFYRVRAERPAATPTAQVESLGRRRRFRFRVGSMVHLTTVRATVSSTNDGYAVAVVLEKNGRSHTLAEKTVDSRVEAETLAIELAAHHGIPWHKVEVLYR
jgi:hypothetical protein